LSVQRSFLPYKSQCLKKVNVKYVINRLWHEIFNIVPGISPRFRVLYKCFVKSTQHIDIWMQIPIQDDVYIWANYSVSSYLNFIPIFWNVLIWLKYDFTIFPCTLTYLFWDQVADTRSYIRGQIRIFEGQYGYMRANNQHWLLAIIGHAKTNILQQNMW
jgi:hypothetical protein